jgi:hypothetical protein
MGVGEILDGAFATLRQNPAATLGMAFVVVAVVEVLRLVATLAIGQGSDAAGAVVDVVATLLNLVAQLILAGALTVVVSEAVLGRRISIQDAVARLKGRVGGLLGLAVLIGLIILALFVPVAVLTLVVALAAGGGPAAIVGVLGVLTTIVPALYVGVLLTLSAPAFVLERGRVTEAMRRSRELVRGSWWRVFGILLLGVLIVGIVSAIISIPFTVAAGANEGFFSGNATGTDFSAGSLILLAIGRIISGTLTIPISAGISALLYVDQRMRREGLDLTLAQAAREQSNEPRTGP